MKAIISDISGQSPAAEVTILVDGILQTRLDMTSAEISALIAYIRYYATVNGVTPVMTQLGLTPPVFPPKG